MFPLSHRWRGKKTIATSQQRPWEEQPVWVGKVEFPRSKQRLPAAGLSLHKPKVWDSLEQDAQLAADSQVLALSDGAPAASAPTGVLVMLRPCVPTHGQVAVPLPPRTTPSANFFQATRLQFR